MATPDLRLGRMIVLCGLSLSLGWGIRGNFGHEYGAMIPGALAAIAAVVMSGREDWWRRVGYFALFGAVGWSFGGSISYMHVIAYTHSGHLPSQVYGFACLFVIGFLWGALGGAGTALPAWLNREQLTSLFPPMLAVFVAWQLQDYLIPLIDPVRPSSQRHESFLYWYDTDWIAALVAIIAVLILAVIRRRICWGTSFILHLAVGWWVMFLFLVLMVDGGLGIEFRMTPPRGDNWAGILGMTGGALVYFVRHGMIPVAHAALTTGFFGGFGFTAATALKLGEVKYAPMVLTHWFGQGAWQTNWHSILEQTYGFFNGVGVAVAMAYLARRLPRASDQPRIRAWTEVVATAFVLLGITYVNLVKDVAVWVQQHAVPASLYGVRIAVWFNVAYGLLALAVIALLARHLQYPLALIPESRLGKGQLLYLVFLWWVVAGNLMHAIPPFPEERLITEGVIHVNAVLCTLMILVWPRPAALPDPEASSSFTGALAWVVGLGVCGFLITVVAASWGTRLMYGNAYVGHAGYHVRFGPDAVTGKPRKGEKHP
jgi:hypothetical protein